MKHLLVLLALMVYILSLNAQDIGITNTHKRRIIRDFKKLNSYLDTKKIDRNTFTRKLKNFHINDSQELLGGYQKLKTAIDDNLDISSVAALVKDENIFLIRIKLSTGYSELLQEIGKEKEEVKFLLDKNWSSKKHFDEYKKRERPYYEYNFKDTKRYNQYKLTIEERLGMIPVIEEKDSLIKEAYNLLISPIEHYYFGSECNGGESGHPDLIGRKAIDILIKNKKIDLIKNILKGFNPEGRAYAFDTLVWLHHKKKINLNKKDIEILSKITKLDCTIYSCLGCERYSNDDYKTAFEQEYIWEIYENLK